jgi:hypothetical protein
VPADPDHREQPVPKPGVLVAARGVATRTFDGRILACAPVANLRSVPPVIVIEGTAAAVWARLAKPAACHAIAGELAELFDSDPATVGHDLEPLLSSWLAAGLIVEAS